MFGIAKYKFVHKGRLPNYQLKVDVSIMHVAVVLANTNKLPGAGIEACMDKVSCATAFFCIETASFLRHVR